MPIINLTTSLNGLKVVRGEQTIFVPLPTELWTPIGPGCSCPFCKMHPQVIPSWDTLAVSQNKKVGSDTTWLVHYPENHPFIYRVTGPQP